MSSIKCTSCGLTNFASETHCRRCGMSFLRSPEADKAPGRSSLASIIVVAFAAIAVFYFVFARNGSTTGEATANNADSNISRTSQTEFTGESRMILDRQRANHIGNAMNVNPSLDAHQKRVQDSQKMMEQITNSSQK